MKTRPWSIVVLALMQVFTPVMSILLSSWMLKISPITFVTEHHFSTWWSWFEFYALMPLAGVAIYCVKKWSYPVFLGATLWMCYSNLVTWRSSPESLSIPIMIGVFMMSAVLVGYFLIPQVRVTYFNPKVRWWESRPRYPVNLRGQLEYEGHKKECMIENLSDGGAFIKSDEVLNRGDQVSLWFSVFSMDFELSGQVVHMRDGDCRGYGIQFRHTPGTLQEMKKLVHGLDIIGMKPTIQRASFDDFLKWSREVLTRGKGVVPAIPNQYEVPPFWNVNSPAFKAVLAKAYRARRIAAWRIRNIMKRIAEAKTEEKAADYTAATEPSITLTEATDGKTAKHEKDKDPEKTAA